MTRRVIEAAIRRPVRGVGDANDAPPRPASKILPATAALTALATIAAAAALCIPPAWASSGPSGGASVGAPPGQTARPASLTVSAAANGMTITARESTPLHMALAVNGTLASADAGSSVEIELMGVRTAWSWQPVAQTEVQSDGSYATTVKPKHPGQYAVRAVLGQAGAVAAATLPTITVIVYRPATATFYGPGFYGHRTACGKILRRSTVGVANRTLPCGTRVAVYYGGEMIVVPVIDRGPYANGANWDLTMATAKALAMYTTATIGAAPVPVHP